MNLEIESNTRVTLNFSLTLETGEEVDSNFGAEPVSFVMGDGSLLPGFERRLLGMRPGDEAEFRIPPEEGFGTPQDDNIQSIPRADFGSDAPLEPGMVLTVEPGLYVSDRLSVPEGQPEIDERWKGIGIRIEDDVAVTETSHEVLTAGALKSVAAMER